MLASLSLSFLLFCLLAHVSVSHNQFLMLLRCCAVAPKFQTLTQIWMFKHISKDVDRDAIMHIHEMWSESKWSNSRINHCYYIISTVCMSVFVCEREKKDNCMLSVWCGIEQCSCWNAQNMAFFIQKWTLDIKQLIEASVFYINVINSQVPLVDDVIDQRWR